MHMYVCMYVRMYVCMYYSCIFLPDESVHTSQMVTAPSHLLYIDCAVTGGAGDSGC